MSISFNLFRDKNLEMLKKSLDASSLRQQTIVNNIANINTKGYKAKRVDFEEELKKALGTDDIKSLVTTNGKHIGGIASIRGVKPIIVEDTSTSVKSDGNNVDIDSEMVILAKNQLIYNALVQQTSKKLSNLRYVINEGRR